jgi:hypothetical protein
MASRSQLVGTLLAPVGSSRRANKKSSGMSPCTTCPSPTESLTVSYAWRLSFLGSRHDEAVESPE